MSQILIKAMLLATMLLSSGCAFLNKFGTASGADAEAGKANVWSPSLEAKRVALDKATEGTGISVLRSKDNQLQVNVPSDFSFDSDSAAIKPGMRPVLDQFAADLKADTLSQMVIHIVGYTDSRGTDAVNDTLSRARAAAVAKYLEGRGIAASRIEVEGRGESQPLVGNEQPYGRALNRRIEIFLREPAAKSM